MIGKDGVTAISLEVSENDRFVNDLEGNKCMFHSIKKCNYLKTEPSNLLVFQYKNEHDTIIKIQEHYKNKK